MAKQGNKYLKVHPHKIIEEGYHPDRHQVSESLFSLSNEYVGVRGYFDEGISNTKSLRGTYFNGIYDYSREYNNTGYKGIATRTHFMVNAVDFFKLTFEIDGERLDLNKVKFKDFRRELSMQSGEYSRSFNWILTSGKEVTINIKRLLSMSAPHFALQKITLHCKHSCVVKLSFVLDNNLLQWGQEGYFKTHSVSKKDGILVSETIFTKQRVYTKMDICHSLPLSDVKVRTSGEIVKSFTFELTPNHEETFTRFVTNITSREFKTTNKALEALMNEAFTLRTNGYDFYLNENIKYYKTLNDASDINIIGNDDDLQGIRYCTFMLNSTYHGYSRLNNLGAKGLTGEAYSGHAFWDSETYCLTYYLFNNIHAARDLILFRYDQLPQAKKRALELDCRGACYPIATLNGEEGCTLWQHASLQPQATTGVNYALYHYYNITKDFAFIKKYGLEILKETCQFLLDRGQYNFDRSTFGYYAVMGPDEFKMMVNNNAYTNFMGKFSFELLLKFYEQLKGEPDFEEVVVKLGLTPEFIKELEEKSVKMKLMYDERTKLFEQNDNFFTLPHIDIKKIPQHEFPLYSNWTYDRIYRGDMIKQPDVLMFMFLFNSHFTKEEKKANYDYYEPRTIHESSLSPSIHSIFASELGYKDQAINFFGYASRLDLDDYNNNANEGLHLTSMAAAWMNIVYGFGGFRSDGPVFKIAPSLPNRWQGYSFKLTINTTILTVEVKDNKVKLSVSGAPLMISVYDKIVTIEDTYETQLN